MKGMTSEDALSWCRQVGLRLGRSSLLTYQGPGAGKLFVRAPEEFRKIVVFARQVLAFRGEGACAGGLILFQRWDIGSPQSVRVGWQIIEGLRRLHGDLRPLELAPGQLFRDDEFLQLHTFLIQIIGFGWVADFVPSVGGYFVRFKDNGQMCFTASSPETLGQLRHTLNKWNPMDEDPMTAKLRLLGLARKGKKDAAKRGQPEPPPHR